VADYILSENILPSYPLQYSTVQSISSKADSRSAG